MKELHIKSSPGSLDHQMEHFPIPLQYCSKQRFIHRFVREESSNMSIFILECSFSDGKFMSLKNTFMTINLLELYVFRLTDNLTNK